MAKQTRPDLYKPIKDLDEEGGKKILGACRRIIKALQEAARKKALH